MLGYGRKSEDFASRIDKKFELRLKDLPKEHQDSIREVKAIEDERREMLLEHEKEVNQLKAKFELQSNEILGKRASIMNENSLFKYFWMKTLINSKATFNLITDEDKKPLKYLTNISDKQSGDQKSIQLVFHFEANEFFTNTSLVKDYKLGDDHLIQSIKSTSINWKQGKKYYAHKKTKRMKNKKSGEFKEMEIETCDPSFFNFFCNLSLPSQEQMKQLSSEKEKEFADALDKEYDMMMEIIEEIIPHSIEYYVGVVHDNEEYTKYLEDNLF